MTVELDYLQANATSTTGEISPPTVEVPKAPEPANPPPADDGTGASMIGRFKELF